MKDIGEMFTNHDEWLSLVFSPVFQSNPNPMASNRENTQSRVWTPGQTLDPFSTQASGNQPMPSSVRSSATAERRRIENDILILTYPWVRCGKNLIFALCLPSCRSAGLTVYIWEKMFHLFSGVPNLHISCHLGFLSSAPLGSELRVDEMIWSLKRFSWIDWSSKLF